MLKSEPFYWLVCDYPDCNLRSTENGEYAAWQDEDMAVEEAQNSDWLITDDGKHYCEAHSTYNEAGDWVPAGVTIAERMEHVVYRVQQSTDYRIRTAQYAISSYNGRPTDRRPVFY